MPGTIYEAFRESALRHSGKAALRFKGDDGRYRGVSFDELDLRVTRLAASLAGLGIGKGDRVGIFAYHGCEWVTADLATLKLGAVVVPLYHTLSASAAHYILSDAQCKLVFVEGKDLLDVVDRARPGVPSLAHVVVFDDRGIPEDRACLRFRDLIDAPRPVSRRDPDVRPAVSPDDVATIVYTSGTTGTAKGVVLTHGNILSNAFAAVRRFHVGPQDAFLSFLPLSHMLERTCGYYAMLFAGATIAYADDLTTIVRDVQAIRPTILMVVPRIVEKIYEAVQREVFQGPFVRRWLVLAAIRNLNQRANRLHRGQPIPLALRLKCAFYDRAVAARFREIAGGRLRLLMSGGAPLDRKLAKALYVLGFNVLEGYGLTETSPIVCTAILGESRLGTVGKPLDGVEVRLGELDEILVRGPNVMRGYLGKPEETAAVIDADGWFHTGDQGRFDDHGDLIITGRLKELIVTSYGKKVPPVPIEAEIMKSGYIEHAILCGEKRTYITALIVPHREALERYALEHGIPTADYAGLVSTAAIRELIAGEIERASVDLAPFEKVKAFTTLPEGFTVANELLTPTLKLRRKKVLERYRDEIDAMYATSKDG